MAGTMAGMDILLVAGLWLRHDVWDDTVHALRELGHEPRAVALPGVDDGDAAATLDDQVDAVLAAIDAAGSPLLVGHSAACTLAWIGADRRPTTVRGVALIGGFPSVDGERYADFFPVTDGVMPFPGWEPFEGPDAADLDAPAREAIASRAVPVPAGVARGLVRLRDERRFAVPCAILCPEFSPEQARAWVDDGQVPELARTADVRYLDIASGHWPMVTQPRTLARLLDETARRRAAP